MLIAIRCTSCGKVLADKWLYYEREVKKEKKKLNIKDDELTILNVKLDTIQKTPEGIVMDKLGLTRYCCRRMMLSTLDLIDII
jgi:DNA-directed RNA polymerase subunit N